MNPTSSCSETSPPPTSSTVPTYVKWQPPSRNGTLVRQPRFERVSTIWARVKQDIASRTVTPLLPFGILPLDTLTQGLRRGKLTVLAARSSQGKTSMACQIAWSLADAKKTVAYFTLEDDRESITERLFSHLARVDNQAMRRGLCPNNPLVEGLFDKTPLLIMDGFGYNVTEIAHVVETLSSMPDVIVVDYAQMIDDDQAESEYRAIAVFVRHLKLFAEHAKIAVLLCSQINRQGAQEGRPSLHHLARCGRLEEMSDTVLLLYWPHGTGDSSYDYQGTTGFAPDACPRDYYELSVEKNKTGPKGVVTLRFVGEHYRFESWAGYEDYHR
mgnify:CR=1 FL=1